MNTDVRLKYGFVDFIGGVGKIYIYFLDCGFYNLFCHDLFKRGRKGNDYICCIYKADIKSKFL